MNKAYKERTRKCASPFVSDASLGERASLTREYIDSAIEHMGKELP